MFFRNFSKIHSRFVGKESYLSIQLARTLKKLSIITSITKSDGVLTPKSSEVLLTQGVIKFSYEAMMPLMRFDGQKQKIFIFIVAYLMDHENYTFSWNAYTVDAYMNYFEEVTGEAPKISAIKQEFKELRLYHNIFRKIGKDTYMMNPLYLPRHRSDFNNKKLFNEFNKPALEKAEDVLASMDIQKVRSSKGKA